MFYCPRSGDTQKDFVKVRSVTIVRYIQCEVNSVQVDSNIVKSNITIYLRNVNIAINVVGIVCIKQGMAEVLNVGIGVLWHLYRYP